MTKTSPARAHIAAIARRALRVALLTTVVFLTIAPANSAPHIKDIATFQGVRDNLLVGYGLLVGLNGTELFVSVCCLQRTTNPRLYLAYYFCPR